MPCFYPLDAWRQPGGEVTFHDKGAGRPMQLACGQCIGCRLKRANEWALRITHEASLYKQNCFITLTYNNESMPRDGSLSKKDFPSFMKRLRAKYSDIKIRFYQAGEYGDLNGRPHHHAILFNFMPCDLVAGPGSKSSKVVFHSPELERIWGKGFVNVGEVTFESAAYVARYCMKKINGLGKDKINEVTGLKPYERFDDITGEIIEVLPEFSTMSRRPGIGYNWIRHYASDCYPKDFITVRGLRKQPPRYYDRILRELDEDTHDYIKAIREEEAYLSPDNSIERLKQRESCTNARLRNLTRSL